MGGTGSGRTTTPSVEDRYLDRKLGGIQEKIKELRDTQTDNQKAWLDLAEGGLAIFIKTMTEAIAKERLAFRQLGAIEYFYDQAVENRVPVGKAKRE